MSQAEKVSAILLDLDGTLTDSRSVAWLDLTLQIFLKAGRSIQEANEARESHKQIYAQYSAHVKALDSKVERESYFQKMKTGLFQLWGSSGLTLSKNVIEQISKEAFSMRLKSDGKDLLHFLKALNEQLDIPTYIITGAYSVLAEMVATEFNLAGGRANSLFIFDENEIFVDFQHDSELSRNKVKHLFELVREQRIIYDLAEIVVVGDGPTDDELIYFLPNNIIVDNKDESHLISSYVNRRVSSLHEVISILFEQLGERKNELTLPESVAGILRARTAA